MTSQPSEIAGLFEDTVETVSHANFMLYGPPGSGKSTGAATAPGPILWLNADRPNALLYAKKVARKRGTNIFEVRLDYGTDPRAKLSDFLRYLESDEGREIRTVVIDTVGEVRSRLADVLVTGTSKNTFQEWGAVAKVLEPIIKTLRDMPVNVVLTAHQAVSEEDGLVRPLIGGALTEKVPADMDVVAYCGLVSRDGVTECVGQIQQAKGRYAKDCSDELGAARPVDLSEWLRVFSGEVDVPFAEAVADA
jgi:hypothetical protein